MATLTSNAFVHGVDTNELKAIPIQLIDSSPFGIRDSRSVNLRTSMKRLGILQPITVRKKNNRYEVVFGDGRLIAAKAEGRKTIPCFIRDCDDNEALLLHLTENLARENLTPLEEGKAFELLQEKFGWSVREISEFLGHHKEKSVIASRIKMNKLPDDIKEDLKSHKLTVSQVELIQQIVPPKFLHEEAKYIAEKSMSHEETEAYLISQEPMYKIHRAQTGGPLVTENREVNPAKPDTPVSFKVHEFRITGKIESDFQLENLELTIGPEKRIRLFQEIREALRKISAGDEVEVTVTIWAAARSRPTQVS